MDALQPFVDSGATVVLGVNLDDLDDHRQDNRPHLKPEHDSPC